MGNTIVDNKLNEDFICVVREKDNELEYVEVKIEKEYQDYISAIYEVLEKTDISLPMIQTFFSAVFSENVKSYSYCLPYSYQSIFVDNADYPKIYSKEEYEEELAKVRQDFISKETESLDKNKKEGEIDDDQYNEAINSLEGQADEVVMSFNSRMREKFKNTFERYIHACEFSRTLNEVKSDNHNIMYSSEDIGFTRFLYSVNKDIKILVRTNFCYGRSAYFHISLIYKDILILSYPDFIRYYYADMIDFIDCTRSYVPKRENWEKALSFVVEQANWAIQDEDTFVKKWIIEGTSDMIQWLRRVYESPTKVLDSFLKDVDDENIYTMRNITKEEIAEYKIYRDEMTIAFQAEKISGTLLQIQNLKKLSELYEEINLIVEQIECINRDFFPALYHADKSLERKITIPKEDLLCLENEYDGYRREHISVIRDYEIYESHFSDGEDTLKNYIELHPDVDDMVIIKNRQYKRQIENAKDDVKRLNGFHAQLSRCAQLICDYGLANRVIDDYLSTYVNKAQELLAIRDGNMLMSKDRRRLFSYSSHFSKSKTDVVIPDSFKVICSGAFSGTYSGCTLHNIELSSNLKFIGSFAFQNCPNIEEIIIPDSVETIDSHVFEGCKSLKKVILSSSMKKIPMHAFTSCESLTLIVIPESIEKIDFGAFFYCKSLETITLPGSLKEFSHNCFMGCDNLKTIYIPKGTLTKYRRLLWLYVNKLEER